MRNSGRGKGRGGGNFGRGRGGRGSFKSSSNSNNKTITKIEDCVFHIGTARQASEYNKNKDFIVNYIGKEYNNGKDIATALKDLKDPDTDAWKPKPADFMSQESNAAKKKAEEEFLRIDYKEASSEYRERLKVYENNKFKAYSLIWERCSAPMKSQLESRDNFLTAIEGNPIALLEAIKQHALNYKEHRYEMSIISDALKTVLLSKQKEDEDLVAYTKRFKTAVEVLKSHMGGPIVLQNYVKSMEGYSATKEEFMDTIMEAEVEDGGEETAAEESDGNSTTAASQVQRTSVLTSNAKQTMKLIDKAYEQLLAFIYLDNADKKKYGSLLNALSQQQSLKNDQYPKSMTAANQVLANHRHDNAKDKKEAAKKQSEKDKGPGKGSGKDHQNPNVSPLELSFAQMLKGCCHICGLEGHWANTCKKKGKIPKEQYAINVAKKKDAAFHQFQQASQDDGAGSVANNQGPPSVVSAPAATTGWAGVQLQRIKGVQCFIAGNIDMKKVILLDNETTSSIFGNDSRILFTLAILFTIYFHAL